GVGTGSWSPPAGVEQRTVDQMGTVVSEGCVPEGGTYTEYFIGGSAPSANCYSPDYYAYGDTLGYLDDDWRDDSLPPLDTAAGWCERLRRRVRGDEDSVRRAPRPVDPA